ncbi:MAG TPA: glycosyltransferase family 4 protein, partial [Terriglobales bacterium]
EGLCGRGVAVTACSVRRPSMPDSSTVYLFPLQFSKCLAATWLLLRRFPRIRDLVARALRGPEPISRRMRALAHTWLGAYCAAVLKTSHPDHIHVHHGYFASWVGLVAARFLGVGFSMTLHGSDLLLRADYLDIKLKDSNFCFTVSEFNRGYILDRYPWIAPDKILVQRLGVDPNLWKPLPMPVRDRSFHIVSVGRLHAIKNHGFLLLACHSLKSAGVKARCTIAGDGPERASLEQLVARLGLQAEVTLAGHIPRRELPSLYTAADVVVLTSRSEGIPLTLMEAMAMERVVIAPAITGIPELVLHGHTGFLYRPGSLEDLLLQLRIGVNRGKRLAQIRRGARQHVIRNFNKRINLAHFAKTFLSRVELQSRHGTYITQDQAHENPVLQQI